MSSEATLNKQILKETQLVTSFWYRKCLKDSLYTSFPTDLTGVISEYLRRLILLDTYPKEKTFVTLKHTKNKTILESNEDWNIFSVYCSKPISLSNFKVDIKVKSITTATHFAVGVVSSFNEASLGYYVCSEKTGNYRYAITNTKLWAKEDSKEKEDNFTKAIGLRKNEIVSVFIDSFKIIHFSYKSKKNSKLLKKIKMFEECKYYFGVSLGCKAKLEIS